MAYIIILILILLIPLIWAVWKLGTESKKDWKTLEYLEEKVKSVTTKEEIEAFHKELREKSKGVYNKFVNQRFWWIDAYLRGMYQQIKNEEQLFTREEVIKAIELSAGERLIDKDRQIEDIIKQIKDKQ